MDPKVFSEDLLELSTFATRLESFIEVERGFVDGGLVLSLNAPFGTGKTTFLRMWKTAISEKGIIGINISAWESDYYGDPLFAIISELIPNIDPTTSKKLKGAIKSLGWFAVGIGNQIVSNAFNIDPLAAGDVAESKKEESEKSNLHDGFAVFQHRKRAMAQLKDILSKLFNNPANKIIFLIDELDRCRPDYAIAYLETIKHIFDTPGAVFILAIDRDHLENSARTAFGEKLNFTEYYRKFIHREIPLPQISPKSYNSITTKYCTRYLSKSPLRRCVLEIDRHRIDNISELLTAFKLTPRQIQDVFRTMGHILGGNPKGENSLLWGLGVGSIMMAAIKIGSPNHYHALGCRNLQPSDAVGFFRKISERNWEWWFMICLTGGGIHLNKEIDSVAMLKELGISENRLQASWSDAWGGFGRNNSRIIEIYTKIEDLSQWEL